MAPEPSKFCSSPVGKRTSTPAANPKCSPWYTSYLPRRSTSPIPVAVPELEKVAFKQGVAEPQVVTILGLNWWKAVPVDVNEFCTIVALVLTFMLTSSIGTATEKSRWRLMPYVAYSVY